MRVERAANVRAFLERAGTFLEAREAEHNLIFGICSTLEADPSQFEAEPYLAAIIDGDRVVGAAIRTPPWRLVLSLMDHPDAVARLAADLAGQALPGAVGPVESVGPFAEAWGRQAGLHPRLLRHERSFRLRSVRPPRPARGAMARAQASDLATLSGLARAFHEEAMPGGPDQDYDRMAERWIKGEGRTAYLWFDEGRPVSLAGAGGLTPNGIRVGPVYTPPELRSRGYASNLVAGVSQLQLDGGRTFVFLFTDLANPTANRIYQAIGYEPVNDIDEWDFGG
jgi:predicted GNAT family acetyltransferase